MESLLPDKVNISKVGGPGKEFWVESTQTNYEAETSGDAAEPGAWRIEISPVVMSKSDVFLHVMSVMHKDTPDSPDVEKIESSGIVGAKALDAAVLFSEDGQLLETAEFVITGGGETKILVCDLKLGVWSINRNGSEISNLKSEAEGKCLYFKGLPGKYSLTLTSR